MGIRERRPAGGSMEEEGVDGGGEESEEDEEDGALSVLQQRYGKMRKKGTYSAAGLRGFEAVLFEGDDILLHRD